MIDWQKDVCTHDNLLHLAGGFIFAGALMQLPKLVGLVVLIGVAAYFREASQHNGKMNPHRWIEALAWPLGGLLAGLVYF